MNQIYSRRKFLVSSAAGIGSLASAQLFPSFGEENKGAWVNNMQINPAIDNLRVVNCTDPAMITVNPTSWDIISQNAPVVAEKVYANMDAMAIALAQKPTAAEAWTTIFQKPQAKNWSEVTVAIKPNGSGKNNTRVAVINKVCSVLFGFGVQEKNIILYGCHKQEFSDEAQLYRPMLGNGLPAGIILSKGHDALGGTVLTDVPKPSAGRFNCAAALANGSIDILVNIATNKGHIFDSVGGLSMTMKNHAGSFEMYLSKHFHGGLKYIIAFNKSKAIIGGTPPRQQLCIVDSLWGLKKGPPGIPNKRPCSLSMGTFSPAVDWVVMKRIREQLMGCTHPASLALMLTEFGYHQSQFEDLNFIKVEPV